MLQVPEVERLREIAEGSVLDDLGRERGTGVRGDRDDGDGRVEILHGLQDIHPVDAPHGDVEEDEIGTRGADQLERSPAVAGRRDVIGRRQVFLKNVDDVLLVIDHEDPSPGRLTLGHWWPSYPDGRGERESSAVERPMVWMRFTDSSAAGGPPTIDFRQRFA